MARVSSLSVAVSLALFSASAHAFSLETIASEGCHEKLAHTAAGASRWPSFATPPPVSHDDEVLGQNVQFTVPAGTNRWTLAMMIGVRDNDLEGHSLTDLPELAAVHGAADQSAHCLRNADQDFEGGDEAAIAACRVFIHGEVAKAFASQVSADLDATEEVMVSMRYQRQKVRLSRYAFHMGRAMHALQDSYAHSFRRSEDEKVVSVLNYIDAIIPIQFNEQRDGHPHLSAMDSCSGSPLAEQRAKFAENASLALLNAVADSTSEDDRRARLDTALDQAFRYDASGCAASNGFCGSLALPQAADGERGPAQGCSTTSCVPFAGLAMMLALRRRARTARALSA